jgi:hypothetical protein
MDPVTETRGSGMTQGAAGYEAWRPRYRSVSEGGDQLACFPHAGGWVLTI